METISFQMVIVDDRWHVRKENKKKTRTTELELTPSLYSHYPGLRMHHKIHSFLGWVPVDLGPTSLDEIGSLLGTSKVS